MGKVSTVPIGSSRTVWDYLEEMVRMKVREFMQDLLEDDHMLGQDFGKDIIPEMLGKNQDCCQSAKWDTF